MRIPDEFKRMVRRFDADSMVVPFDEWKWIDAVLGKFDGASRLEIRAFLDEVSSRNLSGRELQDLWQEGDPEYILSDKDLRTLLRMIQERL